MQTLPRMPLSGADDAEALQYRMDEYLQRIYQVVNHNAQEIEVPWALATVANGTYPIWIPLVPRKIVAVNAVLQAGTCSVAITQATSTVSWKTAGGTSLSCSTTEVYDTASSANEFVAGTKVTVAVSGAAGAAGLALTLQTGSQA